MGFWKIILGSFAYLLEYRRSLFQALLIPLALTIAIGFIPLQQPNYLERFVLSLVQAIINTIVAVNVYRIILLGPDSVSKWGMGWTRRESKFLLNSFILGLIATSIFFLTMIVMSAFGISGAYVLIVAGVLITYVISRLYLILPAVAVEHKLSFKDSWNMTRDRQFMMALVIVVFPVLLIIPLMLLLSIPYMEYLVDVLAIIVIVLTISAVSVAYKVLSNPEKYT